MPALPNVDEISAQCVGRQLVKIRVATGVYWVAVPQAKLSILCGCPADAVKHLVQRGLIVPMEVEGVGFESGPNAILLSDRLMQNGRVSNLSEFPVLQMLYRQGLILPDHPNNTGLKPLLIGSQEQVAAQKEYIYRGNYGLTSEAELMEAGLSRETAQQWMRIKLKFAFGRIKKTDELIDSVVIGDEPVEIRNGVCIRRLEENVFEFTYGLNKTVVNLNLEPNEAYEPPFTLGFHQIPREYFAVIHSGEGDGWDASRPCMASILMFQGRIYLIDAGPNISASLQALGIDPTEIEGIFHSHAHDDHFAGLPSLMACGRKIDYFATPLVRVSVAKKLSALMGISEADFGDYFNVRDLACDVWNNIDGLEVQPVLSPHPVETNIFRFRAFWRDGYHTYAHLADIASLDVLNGMLANHNDEIGISAAVFAKVKEDYFEAAELKKIDIGGGLIHGNAVDFSGDKSKKIILAHKAGPLDKQEKAIGSDATFGALDVLIETNRDYLGIKAEEYLRQLFGNLPPEKRELILNSPVVSFNPGSVIFKNNTNNKNAYLILTGTVEYIDSEKDVQKRIGTGSLVGDMDVLKGYDYSGTFRAASYISALEFTADLYRFARGLTGPQSSSPAAAHPAK